jgi:hypothetical protein
MSAQQPPQTPAPAGAKSGIDLWGPRILGAIVSAPVVLGVIKTFAEAGTGTSFTLGDVTYYIGWAAVGVWCGFFLCGLIAGGLIWLLTEVLGADEDQVENPVVALGVVLFIATVVLITFSADPPAESGSGAVFFRVVGLLTVIGGGVVYAAVEAKSD